MGTQSVRLSEDLVSQAKKEAKIHQRSIKEQIEHWARLGKAIESQISLSDVYAISQGLMGFWIVPPKNEFVNPEGVFDELEADRRCGFAGKLVTTAPFYFEASIQQPGFLDKVHRETGKRQTGTFKNGVFQVLDT